MTPIDTSDVDQQVMARLFESPPACHLEWSEAARNLRLIGRQIYLDVLESARGSIFLGAREEIKSQILEYFETRNTPGWDGYNALPVTDTSKGVALQIAEQLPPGIVKPDVIPIATGGLSFEWESKDKVFSLEIKDQELVWSFIDFHATPKRKRSGIEGAYASELPRDIIELLKMEFKAA